MRSSVFVIALIASLASCDIDEDAEFRSCEECGQDQGQDQDQDQDRPVYPGEDWIRDLPENHGLSSEGLEAVAEIAESYDSSCLLVAHEGKIVGEWYWNGYDANTDQDGVFSITKSVTATLLGIADAQGLLDINDSAADYIPQWQGTELENITVRDLMIHTSGRTYSVGLDFELNEQYDQTAFAISVGQNVPPGFEFIYSNVGYQTLEAVLQSAVGDELQTFAQEELFAATGMTVSLRRDGAGNTLTYRGLSASCQDLARLGYLYLQNGRWKGEQVLPRAWVKKALRPSQDFNDSYGYGWWLNEPGHVILPLVAPMPEYEGKFLPSAPEGVVTALGASGNILSVDLEDGYILVFLREAFEIDDILGLGKADAIWAAFEEARL